MPAVWEGILLSVTMAVIFVNGWTDAPNAIASAVSTGAMRYRSAVGLAAVCNLAGILAISLLNASVTDTVTAMARFEGGTLIQSAAALCAAMVSIVVFAVAAWALGIPTSESHALIAALTGAALALGGAANIGAAAWGKVLWGLGLSLAAGLGLGRGLTALLGKPLRRLSSRLLRRMQVAAAGGMAFLHGAQDGQKFVAVLVTMDLLAQGRYGGPVNVREHPLALLFCAAAMALGTAVGGKRIVDTVGGRMVSLDRVQGVCADLAGGTCLLMASLWGVPMSTTHTKTTAMMGAGLAGGRAGADKKVIGRVLAAWGITFPACGLLGFGLTRLFLHLV